MLILEIVVALLIAYVAIVFWPITLAVLGVAAALFAVFWIVGECVWPS